MYALCQYFHISYVTLHVFYRDKISSEKIERFWLLQVEETALKIA